MDSIVEFLLYTQGPMPYVIGFGILILCGLGLPLPEDVILFSLGLMSYYGLADLNVSIIICLIGVLAGDFMIYGFGRKYGVRLLRQGVFVKILPPERMKIVQSLFHRWGNKMIFAARFMPGLRAPTYFTAGSLHLPFRVFVFYDGLAALLSVPLITGATYFFGDHIDRVIQVTRQVQHGIAGLIVVVVLMLVLKHYLAQRRSRA